MRMQPTIERPGERGGALVSWVLLVMALATFAPCVLLPEWRAYQTLQVARQAEEHRLSALQSVVDRERRHLKALRSDPCVISRIAQRELRFRAFDERAVPVSVPVGSVPRGAAGERFVPKSVPPPASLARAGSYLPNYPYDRLFCDERTRIIVMCMSVALMLVALCLPGLSHSLRKHPP